MTALEQNGVSSTSAFASYAPPDGAFDEMRDGEGNVRPHWEDFLRHVNELGEPEIQRRWELAQRQIRDNGISFHPHADAGERARPWTLDAFPVLIAQKEWDTVGAGLEQRAQLLDLLLDDLCGRQLLIRDRIVPPELLFGHPGYHPAYHGLPRPHAHFLHLYAAELARSRDGKWWVTGDRTRAPFGLGYALENRIVTSRMLPVPFRACRVQRLASFFMTLRETLKSLAPRYRDNPHIVLWTKGPSSASYFEDAYLSRYLGYVLAEGGDLAVRENEVKLKTLAGLLPVEVLFRRLDDDDCDPVELRENSACGVSSLLEVIRSGHVAVANALGSRLVESPAFLPFMPSIARHLMGQELQLPTLATWWCGQEKALQYVLGHLNELMLRPAFRMQDTAPIYPGRLPKAVRDDLIQRLRSRPREFVAQELPSRSTAPAWVEGTPQPWYLSTRAFLTREVNGFTVMPGGLARVSKEPRTLDGTMSAGERSQDVWILSDGPVSNVSLLAPPNQTISLRRSGAELPSRVADNLFWLGRYAERAEGAARLLRTVFVRLLGEDTTHPEIPALIRALVEQGQLEPGFAVDEFQQRLPDIEQALPEAVFNVGEPRSLRSTINNMVRLASIVRDRISVDSWRIVHRIDEAGTRPRKRGGELDVTEVLGILDRVIMELVALSGLAAESMTRTQAWRFLELGRRIERAWQTSTLLRATLTLSLEDERRVLEAVLDASDSMMTYRSRYLANLQVTPVVDLLIIDESNPRSIAYQLVLASEHIDRMPRDEHRAVRGPEERLVLSLLNAVRLADVHALGQTESSGERTALDRLLSRLTDQLPKLSDTISSRFLIHAGLPRHFASQVMGSLGDAPRTQPPERL